MVYTYDTFVRGDSNKQAYDKSYAVANGNMINPLFIYGSDSLGKTHLLQAIADRVGNARYISSEKFYKLFLQSRRSGQIREFRAKLCYSDVVLIDDIHYLAEKNEIYEEFFKIMDTLMQRKKQIVLTSNKHPRDMSYFGKRLKEMLKEESIAEIQPPSYEERIAILKKKIEINNSYSQYKVTCSHDVIEYIAHQITSTIRELENALTRVGAYCSIINEPITLPTTKHLLHSFQN